MCLKMISRTADTLKRISKETEVDAFSTLTSFNVFDLQDAIEWIFKCVSQE